MRWIDPQELDKWSASAEAPSQFPVLLRRLIVATTDRDNLVELPGGTSVYFSDWDGRINARKAAGFVPRGRSGWELGTGKEVRNKATSDFRKRTKRPQGLTPSNATFVFATPRVWSGKDKWLKTKRASGAWKSVRVIDATDISSWLEQAPAVGLWLARAIGKAPEHGAASLEEFWSEWSALADPPLNARLVTSGRTAAAEEVSRWAGRDPALLVVEGENREEAVAFVAAALIDRDDEVGHTALSRAVVIRTRDAFRHLAQSSSPLFLIVDSNEEIAPRIAIDRGHHVLVAADQSGSVAGHKAVLGRIGRDEAVAALGEMGPSEEEARRLLHRSSRSVPVLRRRLAALAGRNKPAWADPPTRKLVPPLLLGRWTEDVDGDRACLEAVSGSSADDVHAALVPYLRLPDPPLRRVGHGWRATSHHELWELLGSVLTDSDIDRLAKVVDRTLGAVSPEFELEPDERHAASIHGKVLDHSGALREGIAATLALIGSQPDHASNCTAVDDRAHVIVRELLRGAPWQLWATIGSELPTLAEAAPLAFLEAVEESIGLDRSPFAELFAQETSGILGRCYHSGLLWALERLAWSAEHFPYAVEALAALAEIDPGGTWGNRPSKSLRERFLCWLRTSEASDDVRLGCLERLIERHPRVGWDLLMGILPSGSDSASTSGSDAEWRPWGHGVARAPTYGEMHEYVQALADLAISRAGDDAERWAGLVAELPAFPPDRLEYALSELENRQAALSAHSGRLRLWKALRDVVHHHRSYPTADWAMGEALVDRIAAVYDALAPPDDGELYRWLFVSWPHLPDGDRTDHGAYEGLINEKRRAAVAAIFSSGGADALTAFAGATEQPSTVGQAAALGVSDPAVRRDLITRWLSTDDHALLECGAALCWAEHRQGGSARLNEIVEAAKSEGLSPERIARIFHALRPEPSTWDRLEEEDQSVQDEYWGGIRNVWGFSWDHANEVTRAARSMLDRGNAIAAAALLSRAPADTDVYALALEQLPASLAKYLEEHDTLPLDAYTIAQVFERLEKSGAEPATVAKLEVPFIEILDHTRPNLALHQEVVSEPEAFCSLVTWTFRRSDGTVEDEQILSETERSNRAARAWRLLRSVGRVPGQRSDGTVDGSFLVDWVTKAREFCREADRRDIGDRAIGELLANSPVGRDGIWPCEEIRDALEAIRTRDLARGFETGKHNLRGVTSRGVFDGGTQERSLAQGFLEDADKLMASHPFVARTLRALARTYERMGKGHDTDAEWRDLD